MADKIFKTALILVSLIAGYAYAEKWKYDNEDDTGDNFDEKPMSEEETKEEANRMFETYFEKRRYGIRMGFGSGLYPNFGNGVDMVLGIISEIPLKNGPFILGLGAELNARIIDDPRADIRASSLFQYTSPISYLKNQNAAIGIVSYGIGVFNDFRMSDDGSDKSAFDPGFILALGIRRYKDKAVSILEHMGADVGITFKNPNFHLYMKLTYFFN